jgi:hypothetical protein
VQIFFNQIFRMRLILLRAAVPENTLRGVEDGGADMDRTSLAAPSRFAHAEVTHCKPKSCMPQAVLHDSSAKKVELRTARQGRIDLAANFNWGEERCQRYI